MKRRLIPLAVAAVFGLAGCGSGGGGEVAGEGGEGGGAGSTAYQAAFQLCKAGIPTLAAQYGVEATKKAVADAIVDVAAPNPADEPDARKGCYDALDEAAKK